MQHYTSLSDLELTGLLGTDDPAAFEQIYQRYSGLLVRYATSRIDSREESEEFIQDIFISLWVRRREMANVEALRPYLFNMVKYKIIDHIRHRLVRKKFEDHYLLFEAVYDNVATGDGTEHDFQGEIEKTIEGLPERCRVAFRLRLDENLPYREIAVRMNISIKTVEKHISAALQHLRSTYSGRSFKTRSQILKLHPKNVSS